MPPKQCPLLLRHSIFSKDGSAFVVWRELVDASGRQIWRFTDSTRYEIETTNALRRQVQGTIQLVPKPRKMTITIPRRRRGTWEGVPVASCGPKRTCRCQWPTKFEILQLDKIWNWYKKHTSVPSPRDHTIGPKTAKNGNNYSLAPKRNMGRSACGNLMQ